MVSIIERNKASLEYIKSQSNYLQQICEPLFTSFNIKHFGYVHLYPEKYFYLTNTMKYLEQQGPGVPDGRTGHVNLSYQQANCLHHMACGKTIKEIAKEMLLSPRTIEDYLNKIKDKTGCKLRSDLVELWQNQST